MVCSKAKALKGLLNRGKPPQLSQTLQAAIEATDFSRSVVVAVDGPTIKGSLRTGCEAPLSIPKLSEQVFRTAYGTTLLEVVPSSGSPGGSSTPTLTPQDADEIPRQCPAACTAAPVVRARVQIACGERISEASNVIGTTPAFLAVLDSGRLAAAKALPAFLAARDWGSLAEGRVFSDLNVRSGSRVCLVGETVRRTLFHGESPLGKEVRVGNVAFTVVGVLGRRGADMTGRDQDDLVLAPWTAIRSRLGGALAAGVPTPTGGNGGTGHSKSSPQPVRYAKADGIVVAAISMEQVPKTIAEITELLRERHRIHPGQPDDFQVRYTY